VSAEPGEAYADRVEVLRGGFEAWNRGDIAAWLEPFHDEAEWHPAFAGAIEGKSFHGSVELRRFAEEYFETWDEFRFEPREFREVGDHILVLAHMHVRGAGSGVTLDQEVAFVVRFHEGKVAYGKGYLQPGEGIKAAELGVD
jgi:uncharacterized protein